MRLSARALTGVPHHKPLPGSVRASAPARGSHDIRPGFGSARAPAVERHEAPAAMEA